LVFSKWGFAFIRFAFIGVLVYLQNAKEPRSISQTEKAVEWEQVSSKEQVLPMSGLYIWIFLNL
jgi:hypothetical protein